MHWDKCMIEAPHLLYVRSCTFYLDVFEAGHWQCFPFALWLRHGPYNTLGSVCVWGTLYTTCHGMYVADVVCLRRSISNSSQELSDWGTICMMHWDKCMIEAPHLLYVRSCTFYLDVFEAGHWQCFPFALWLRHGPYNTLGSIYVWGTLYTTCHGMYVADVVCLRRGISNGSQ